jgi:hypothetical protein
MTKLFALFFSTALLAASAATAGAEGHGVEFRLIVDCAGKPAMTAWNSDEKVCLSKRLIADRRDIVDVGTRVIHEHLDVLAVKFDRAAEARMKAAIARADARIGILLNGKLLIAGQPGHNPPWTADLFALNVDGNDLDALAEEIRVAKP